ncbi:MAG: hypothetical protein JWO74_1378 [Solirubrobacterales bacterium]|nr:hypothetical protein [Solirubrobacterales bacterium]
MFDYIPGNSAQRKVSGLFAVKPTRARLVRVAAALSAIAIAAPVSTAAAATAAAGPGDPPAASVTGATYITSAPSTFINTNNQVSADSNSLGGQSAS